MSIDIGGQTGSTNGITGKINLDEARSRATSLKNSAEVMNKILDSVNEQMKRIGDSGNSQAVSYDSKSDNEIKEEFEKIYAEFPKYYNEIIKNAEDIETIAQTMESE